ncbi:hypothetical protein K461DRAFT_289690 [Myriangium duriaei CBS 260.36]|uniref:Rhodopsin domain-containing protein n=1 Tax=Myriangium duriaei CBS 260.36 TaxID=1168546 RepID=A0A9P4MPL4_9PEZI|nr:hypothetical protein K461DRAFT_289690 [Myriangium duriaei CBS 260.36]
MAPLVAPHGGPVFTKWTWILLWVSFVLSGVAVILVGLRIYDVRKNNKGWRWDLIFVSIATFFGIVMELLTGMLTSLNGLGTEQALLTPLQIALALEWAWIGTVFWAWCLCFGKVAIIALYIHITSAAVKRERIFLRTVAAIMISAAVVQTVLIVTTCDPPAKQWFKDIPGTCNLRKVAIAFDYFQGAFSSITDFILALYPIPIVAKMSCSRSTKISICAVMAGGLFPFIAALGRTIALHVLLDDYDATRRWVVVYLWGVVEIWFVIILGSLPPLRAYFAGLLRLDDEITIPGTSYGPSHRHGPVLESVMLDTLRSQSGSQLQIRHNMSESFSEMQKDFQKEDSKDWITKPTNVLRVEHVHLNGSIG